MENVKNSILVVDDEEINLDVLCGVLNQEYTVYMAKGGIPALELADKHIPDLILLDIIMPDISGFEVLTALKSFEKTKNIPVIIITSLNSVEDEEKGLRLGAVDFITKPFSSTVVKTRVENHIQIVKQFHVLKQHANDVQYTLLNTLEAIANNYKGLIWSIDNSGVITYINGQHFKKTSITPSFLIGKNIDILRAKHEQFVDSVLKTFQGGSQDWISEAGGFVFRSHTTLTRDNEGNVTGIVGSSDDVTEMIKLQRDLQASVETAETANRAKSSFLAKMSHEIRTPLNAVLGIAEIQLQNQTLRSDEREVFTRIFNSGNLLLGIINDILDMSKIEAGKLELIQEKYDIANLINDAVYLNMIKYEDKPVEFILNVDENVPAQMFGDELRIKQILNNLLSNAFKYTKEGEIELSINVEYAADFSAEKSDDAVTLVFRVRDTGLGMTPDQIERLFDEYIRFNMEANRTTVGIGLGMGITKNLVHMMNGELLVESESGMGTLFTVRLPQGNTGAAALGKETAQRLKQFRLMYEAKQDELHIEREQIPSGKVLIVDDLDMNLYVIKGMLSLYGLQIDTAESGEEAIGKIKKNRYDLVFMDHMMPVMDGVEATREIRKWEDEEYQRKNSMEFPQETSGQSQAEVSAGNRLPIVALTANAVSGMKEMFLANGFNDFISKPVIIQNLDEVLKEWLSPEKITQREKTEASEEDKTYDSFLKGIEKIGEIDIETGLNQVTGNKGMYRSTLEIFLEKLVSVCNDMTAFLDAKDLKNFAVSVHSTKTMLAIIGASKLSESALELERAAKNDGIDFCKRQFGEFKEKILSLHKKLSAVFQDAAESPANTAILPENIKKAPETASAAAAAIAEKKTFTGKVLLVDDTEMALYINKEKLLKYGLQVDTAASGPEAIEKAKNNTYGLVLMDHVMPGMDGVEATREIRKWEDEEYKQKHGMEFSQETTKLLKAGVSEENFRLPIIALTANVDSGEGFFLSNGFNGYLEKPVKEKLEEILKKWLPQDKSTTPP